LNFEKVLDDGGLLKADDCGHCAEPPVDVDATNHDKDDSFLRQNFELHMAGYIAIRNEREQILLLKTAMDVVGFGQAVSEDDDQSAVETKAAAGGYLGSKIQHRLDPGFWTGLEPEEDVASSKRVEVEGVGDSPEEGRLDNKLAEGEGRVFQNSLNSFV